ncbi:hypothetical protein M758_UG053600 [Ceratodon purpureus]|nr:hypothetical protein M758_UG053600 [Ceratodon purpureus]
MHPASTLLLPLHPHSPIGHSPLLLPDHYQKHSPWWDLRIRRVELVSLFISIITPSPPSPSPPHSFMLPHPSPSLTVNELTSSLLKLPTFTMPPFLQPLLSQSTVTKPNPNENQMGNQMGTERKTKREPTRAIEKAKLGDTNELIRRT